VVGAAWANPNADTHNADTRAVDWMIQRLLPELQGGLRCRGGPHIEIAADGNYSARLEGYWAGEHATLHGDEYDTVLDYFIERGT
jgi:hypothetical protein